MSGRDADFPSSATAVIVVRSTEVGAQDTKENVNTLEECRNLTDNSRRGPLSASFLRTILRWITLPLLLLLRHESGNLLLVFTISHAWFWAPSRSMTMFFTSHI
jgi:hypothetical protein